MNLSKKGVVCLVLAGCLLAAVLGLMLTPLLMTKPFSPYKQDSLIVQLRMAQRFVVGKGNDYYIVDNSKELQQLLAVDTWTAAKGDKPEAALTMTWGEYDSLYFENDTVFAENTIEKRRQAYSVSAEMVQALQVYARQNGIPSTSNGNTKAP